MTVELLEVLERDQGDLAAQWAQAFSAGAASGATPPASEELPRFTRAFTSELLAFLRSGDPTVLRVFAAGPAMRRIEERFDLGELVSAFTTFRDLLIGRLDREASSPHALFRMSRRVSGAIDLLLIELTSHYLRQIAGTGVAPAAGREPLLDHLRREIGRAGRTDQSTTLLLVALDRYPEFVGMYGGTVADMAAGAASAALGRYTRNFDIKIALDEGTFAVILPGTGMDDAHGAAERIRLGVESGDVSDADTLIVSELTVSIGLAVVPLHGDSPDHIFAAARQALDNARMMGGNAVAVYQGRTPANPAFG
jgi:diguanylate cyclase (GGDEF)-like protein